MGMYWMKGLAFGVALLGATGAQASEADILSAPAAPPLVRIDAPAIAPLLATRAESAITISDRHFTAMSDADLEEQRGGAAIIVNNQTLTAITAGNVLNGGYIAGNVSLNDNALSGFNGVGNLLINTGAQVSLQTGMSITINIGG